MDRLSINEVTTYRWTLLQDVVGYQEAGIDAMGVWRPKLSQFGDERGIDLIRESGVAVSSLSWAGGFTGSHGQSFEEAVEDARDGIRIAADLQADCLVVVSGTRAGHTRNHVRRILVDGLRLLADAAGEHGVTIALQPMHALFAHEWSFVTSLQETCDILDECGHPGLGIAFDVYHVWQETGLLERIPQIVPFTSIVKLNDWRNPPRSDCDRCLPGDGCIPLKDIVRSFLAHDYAGRFEMEVWSEDLWEWNYVELLRECRTRYQRVC